MGDESTYLAEEFPDDDDLDDDGCGEYFSSRTRAVAPESRRSSCTPLAAAAAGARAPPDCVAEAAAAAAAAAASAPAAHFLVPHDGRNKSSSTDEDGLYRGAQNASGSNEAPTESGFVSACDGMVSFSKFCMESFARMIIVFI